MCVCVYIYIYIYSIYIHTYLCIILNSAQPQRSCMRICVYRNTKF